MSSKSKKSQASKKGLSARKALIIRNTGGLLVVFSFFLFLGKVPFFGIICAFLVLASIVSNGIMYFAMSKSQRKIYLGKVGEPMPMNASTFNDIRTSIPASETSVGVASCGVMPTANSSASAWSAYNASQDRRFSNWSS